MLTYIIDGFNLLHKIRGLESSGMPRLELVQYIRKNGLTGSRNNRVIIVFDGYDNDEVTNEKEYQIQFSYGLTADDLIKEKISSSKNKSAIFVVTDDNEIRDKAKIEGVKLLSTREFLKKKKNMLSADEKQLSCSEAIEINEELKKMWIKK